MNAPGIRYAHWEFRGEKFVGVLDGDTLRAFDLTADESARGVLAIIEALAQGLGLPMLRDEATETHRVNLLAPIPRPRRNIFCIVKNYWSLLKEVGSETPEEPICYTKVPESVVGHRAPVKSHAGITQCVDYEAELGVIIGREGRCIAEAEAMDHVFGYTIINDIAARDIQYRDGQWDLSKSLDTFCPMGPVITSREAIDVRDTAIRLWVNDELRQDGNTSDFIFSIPTVIATLSRGMTLLPGDVISTGSPAGVGMCMEPPAYLKAGDTVRIEIPGIGELTNAIVD